MAKKGKRDEDEKTPEPGGEYSFVAPSFDEEAFREKEITGSRVTFVVIGLSALLGILAWAINLIPGLDWRVAAIPLLAGTAALKPLLARMKFPEEQLEFRALFGNYFLLFFSGLAVWVILLNIYS